MVPLLILAVAVGTAQLHFDATALGGRFANAGLAHLPGRFADLAPHGDRYDLRLVGYNYNHDLTTISLTLWNAGNGPLTVQGITYDGTGLEPGLVGGAATMFAGPSTGCESPTNEIIFPSAGHWNMDTGGPCAAVIGPGGMVSVYLGATSPGMGRHILSVLTTAGNYTFVIQRAGPSG